MDHESPIAGRFEVLGLGGSGGMGAVLRANDLLTGAGVALKIMRKKDAKARFDEEARILSELHHPGIVRYIAHGQTASGAPYLAMEWLEGEDLKERLAREGLTVGESVELVRRAAEALHCAHKGGVVHRDIKPSNLFLQDGRIDRVKLLDFGIARRHASPAGAAVRNGIVIGTPGYMSPEQAMDGTVDARSDVFSLGCVLFECLTGDPPFYADDVMALLAKILLQDAPRLADIRDDLDPALSGITARMLAKEPDARFPTAAGVAEALSALDAFGAAPPTSARLPRVALGAVEQGLLCVVLVSGEPAPPSPAERSSVPASEAPRSSRRMLDLPLELEGAIARVGGRYHRMINGSAVVTLTGSGAATDLATRAARCALVMKEALPDRPMALAMGRGLVAKGTPVGEVIDRAARVLRAGVLGLLEDPTVIVRADDAAESPARAARDGVLPVFLDSVSAALLEARFDVRPGPAGPELFDERAEAEVTRTLLGKPTPCVGRADELRALLSIFASTLHGARGPEARVVLLTGEPGAGKSRLRAELLRAIARSGVRVEVLVGYGDPMSSGSAFGMIASALRGLSGIKAGEPRAAARAKLGARLARSLRGSELTRAAAFLGALLGLPAEGELAAELKAAAEDPRRMGDRMLEAWQAWISAECGSNPVVIVLEDLHWGDLPSVRFIDAALACARDKPLLVLATARPEVHDAFPGLWAERGAIEIRLRELSEAASEELVRQVLGREATPARITQIIAQAAGNAFYLEELIRASAERRKGSLPPTVLAMVQARLLDLDPEVRRVLRAASVFGQVFWRAGVIALLGGAHRVGAGLEALVEEELCARRGKERFAGEEEYAFRSVLVREAAYATLTDADRALGHKLAGEWLEGAGERDAMALAEHFERGRAPSRALDWYRRGAEQALEGGDFSAAFERAGRAIACGASGEDLGAVLLLAAYALFWQGRQSDAAQHARDAMQSVPRGGDLWYRAGALLALSCGRLGEHEPVEAVAAEMLELSSAGEARPAALVALADAMMLLSIAGRHELADPLHARLELGASALAPLDPEVSARINKARAYRAYFLEGNLEAFLELMAAVVAGYEQAKDLRNACSAASDLGFANIEIGAYDDAAIVLAKAVEQASRLGLAVAEASAKQNLGVAMARLGRWDEARRLEENAIRWFSAQRDPRMEGGARIYLADIHLRRGALDRAEEEIKAAIEVLERAPSMRVHALATRAAIELAGGRIAEARSSVGAMMASLEAQMASFDSLGDSADAESYIRLAHAEVLYAAGDVEGARGAIRAARGRLLERARQFRTEARRAIFLRDVPENARTLELARAWLGEPAP